MAYRSSEKTRQKKDAKRTAMMQAALKVFAEKGYHAATVRDIVKAANVAIGTFYFYFPDKETLFVYLYEETADFLLQSIQQSVQGQQGFPQQLGAGLKAYVNVASYEPAVVQLLLVGGVGSIQSLQEKHNKFRERLITIWQNVLEQGFDEGVIVEQDTRKSAEFISGGFAEMIRNLVAQPDTDSAYVIDEMTYLALQAVAYRPLPPETDPVTDPLAEAAI